MKKEKGGRRGGKKKEGEEGEPRDGGVRVRKPQGEEVAGKGHTRKDVGRFPFLSIKKK